MKLLSAQIKINLPETEKLDQSMCSLMHGMLMQTIRTEDAEKLHAMSLRPFSQYLAFDNDAPCWYINTYTDEAADQLINPLIKSDHLHCRHKGYDIGLSEFKILREESYKDLEKRCWDKGSNTKSIQIEFKTSTSIKSHNTYVIYPTPELIFTGLINKWNNFSDSSILEEDNLAANLAQACSINNYSLRMRQFSLESTWVDAFIGRLSIGRFRNSTAKSMVTMLLDYSQYTGIGIKTALGMGGVSITVKQM